MKFEKKLIILSGGSFAKGTLNLERNAFGTFATFNVYNLPDLNDGEYAVGLKNSEISIKRKLGSLGRILIRFKLDDMELEGIHCVIFDTLNEEPILYGTNAVEKLWDGNMMDGFRDKRSGASVAVQAINNGHDIGGYFLDILQRSDASYCDSAVAAVNYYPQDMNIEINYSNRSDQPPVINPLDEAVRKRNEPIRTVESKLKREAEEMKIRADEDENKGTEISDEGQGGIIERVSEKEERNSENQTASAKKNDSIHNEKMNKITQESQSAYNENMAVNTADIENKAGERAINNLIFSDGLNAAYSGATSFSSIRNNSSPDSKSSFHKGFGESTLRKSNVSEQKVNDSAKTEEPKKSESLSNPTPAVKPVLRMTGVEGNGNSNGDFVIFEPPLRKDSTATRGNGESSVKTQSNNYENTSGHANAFKAENSTAQRQIRNPLHKNITVQNHNGTQVRAQSVAGNESATTVPPVSRYTTDNALNRGTTKVIFYEMVKAQIDELFATYPPFEQLEKMMPDTKWVKVDYDNSGKYYVVGLIGNNPDYLCYGVPSRYNPEPPKDLDGYCQWLPLDIEKPDGDGFWLMFQDAVTGESINNSVSN